MTIRGFGEHTKTDYVRQVRAFAAFIDRTPDLAEPEDLRRYQLYMAKSVASPSMMNQACGALRFFFQITLGRAGFGDRIASISMPERLPVVLSPEEAAPSACAIAGSMLNALWRAGFLASTIDVGDLHKRGQQRPAFFGRRLIAHRRFDKIGGLPPNFLGSAADAGEDREQCGLLGLAYHLRALRSLRIARCCGLASKASKAASMAAMSVLSALAKAERWRAEWSGSRISRSENWESRRAPSYSLPIIFLNSARVISACSMCSTPLCVSMRSNLSSASATRPAASSAVPAA
jgi:hypothetical protein